MKNKLIEIFWLLVVILPSVLPAILGHNIMGTDTIPHLARAFNFHQASLAGQFPPRWADSLFFGYGLPAFVAGASLPYFLMEIFLFFKANIAQSYVLVEIACHFLSAIGVYLAAKIIFGKKTPALVATVIWTYASYHLGNIYGRSAFWEVVASVFPGWSIYAVLLSRRSILLSVILQSFMIGWLFLSHLPSIIVYLPFVTFLYILIVAEDKLKNLAILFVSGLLGLGISATMILPTLFERNYLLATRTLNDVYLNYFSVNIEFPVLIIVTLSVLYILIKKEFPHIMRFAFALFALGIFFNWEGSSVIWSKVPFFKYVLYPSRFYLLINLSAGLMLGAIVKKAFVAFLIIGFVIITFLSSVNGSNDWERINKLDLVHYRKSASTSDEIIPMGISMNVKAGDLSPDPKIISGNGEIISFTKFGKEKTVIVETTVPSVVSMGTLYYPGWQTLVDDQERFPNTGFVTTDKTDYSGMIVQPVGVGLHKIKIRWQETPLRLLANLMTIGSIGAWVILLLYESYIYRKR
ncbi:MAG: hypothetical protein Q7S14_01605 [bacterium]|nr:hypothetical protein [bacterium]